MNMPFELGIDYGSRTYNDDYRGKQFLILETDRYRYMRALSDLRGVDIESHEDNAQVLIRRVRNWGFSSDDIEELPVVEYLDHVRRWTEAKRAP